MHWIRARTPRRHRLEALCGKRAVAGELLCGNHRDARRAMLLQLLGNPDPQMQAVLAHPENTVLMKRLIGLGVFVIPDEESRTKQYREIAQLVAEQPLVHRQDVMPVVAPGLAADAAFGRIFSFDFPKLSRYRLRSISVTSLGAIFKDEVRMFTISVTAHSEVQSKTSCASVKVSRAFCAMAFLRCSPLWTE